MHEDIDSILKQIIIQTDDCIIWPRGKTTAGYGVWRINGVPYYVHRYVLEQKLGHQLSEKVVCHRCDNPSCINPSHLFEGTKFDNTHDAMAKNRLIKAGYLLDTKLTENQVIEIYSRAKSGESHCSIAKDYPVQRRQISRIANKERWKKVIDNAV